MTKQPATFGLRTPADALGKLEREFQRLKTTRETTELIDHGLNFAITAWHILDWVVQDGSCRAKVQTYLGTTSNEAKRLLTKLQKRAKAQCPELEHCRVIATWAKHLECSISPPKDPSFMTNVAPAEVKWTNARGEQMNWTNDKGEPVTWVSNVSDLWIVESGKRQSAAQVFEQTLAWYKTFVAAL